MSYCGAQLFEAIGLNSDTIDKYFTGTASRVEGIGVFEIAAGSDPHAQGRLQRRPGARPHAGRRRRIRLAHARRRAHVDARRDRQAAAQHARQQLQHVQGIRAAHQRPEPPPPDAARPVRVQDRSRQGDSGGRGRARDRDRQALRHRRDVARLDQHRSALHAGRGDEPHRRQEQHRRRRRGSERATATSSRASRSRWATRSRA